MRTIVPLKNAASFTRKNIPAKFTTVNPHNLITVNPEIRGGTPVFKGTRVPVKTLIDYLADSLPLDYFLQSFPSVLRKLGIAIPATVPRKVSVKAHNYR